VKVRLAFAGFIEVDRLAVEVDLGAVLHAVEVDLDDAILPLGRDFELQGGTGRSRCRGSGIVGGRVAGHLPVAGTVKSCQLAVLDVVGLLERLEFFRQLDRALGADARLLRVVAALFELELPRPVERADVLRLGRDDADGQRDTKARQDKQQDDDDADGQMRVCHVHSLWFGAAARISNIVIFLRRTKGALTGRLFCGLFGVNAKDRHGIGGKLRAELCRGVLERRVTGETFVGISSEFSSCGLAK
jgi:hypothetical protein